MAASPTIGEQPIMTGTITEPILGAWRATVESDGEAGLSGQVTMTVDDSSFVGSVRRSAPENGKVVTQLVGGKGAFGADVDAGTIGAKAYREPDLATVLEDILRETGEELNDDSATLAGKVVRTWQRSGGPHRKALEVLVAKAGLTWRVLRNGKLWIGTDAWADFEGEVDQVDANVADGYFELRDAIAMRPGVTYQGERIRQVVHRIGPDSTETEAWIRPASGALDQIRELLRREADYDRPWACQVVSQHADRSLELLPEDPRIRGAGMDLILIAPGLPGLRVEVPGGARCYVEFVGGDPSEPIVTGWDSETLVTLLTIGDSATAQFVALADEVKDRLDKLQAAHDGHVHGTGVGPSTTPTPGPNDPVGSLASVAGKILKVEK